MAHQNTVSSSAANQNAATDPTTSPTGRTEGEQPVKTADRYAGADATDATLAPPAAGEVADDMDEGDDLGADDVQQGGTNSNRPYQTEKQSAQGPETVAANRERLKGDGAGAQG